jgi:hypothetical protein
LRPSPVSSGCPAMTRCARWRTASSPSRSHRRHLSTKQRAMIAARMANVENGSNRYEQKVGSSNEPPRPDHARTSRSGHERQQGNDQTRKDCREESRRAPWRWMGPLARRTPRGLHLHALAADRSPWGRPGASTGPSWWPFRACPPSSLPCSRFDVPMGSLWVRFRVSNRTPKAPRFHTKIRSRGACFWGRWGVGCFRVSAALAGSSGSRLRVRMRSEFERQTPFPGPKFDAGLPQKASKRNCFYGGIYGGSENKSGCNPHES